MLGKKEVLSKIGVKERCLEGMVDSGEFPRGVHIGKCVWWLEEVVETWLAMKFSEQRTWVMNSAARVPGDSPAASSAPDNGAQTPVAPPQRERRQTIKKISTALKAAAVPAPVRLA